MKEEKEKKEEKVEKVEKVSTKATKATGMEGFVWKGASKVSKIAFIASLALLLAAIVFLVFEFIYPEARWASICFDFSICLTFISEGIANRASNKSLSNINLICGGIFLVIGILRVCNVF